jgi:multidrug efflux pump subunit AcrB
VRNSSGTMVPFSAFATSRWETGSPRLERYNGYSAVEIVGEAAPGISTGTAMDMMEEAGQTVAHRLWPRMDGHVLPGTALRRAGAGAVRDFAAGGVPVPGGAV